MTGQRVPSDDVGAGGSAGPAPRTLAASHEVPGGHGVPPLRHSGARAGRPPALPPDGFTSNGNHRYKRLVIVSLALLLASTILIAWKTVALVNATLAVKRDAENISASLERWQREPGKGAALADLGSSLEASSGSLERLQGEMRPLTPLLALARHLPTEVGWIADGPELLDAAVPLFRIGATLFKPFTAVDSKEQVGQKSLNRYLVAVSSAQPQVPYLLSQLDVATPALERLRGRTLGGPFQPYSPQLGKLIDLLPQARQGLKLLGALGPALGTEGPRTYLLLGQNNQEIRATGGFIGSVGVLTLDNGAAVGLEYGSSYEIDAGATPAPPPGPLARYLGLGGWYLRDANWWPDFPATAAQVEQAWLRAGKGAIHGVVALDNVAVEAAMRVAGTLDVPGYGPVSADDFQRKAAEQLYSHAALSSAEAFHKAKGEFLGAVGKTLVDRLFNLPPDRLLPLGQEAIRLLDTRHLQLAFKDQRLVELVHTQGWDGAIPQVDGDSLYLVDTTVSYGDTYSFVKTNVDLQVQLEENGGVRHHLVLNYFNSFPEGLPSWVPPVMVRGASFDLASGQMVEKTGFWGNWLRVYLPAGATAIEIRGLVDPAPPNQQFGRTVLAGYLPLDPGQRRAVTISYLVHSQSKGNYRLFLQKQAGLECRPTSVTIRSRSGHSTSYEGCPVKDTWITQDGPAANP